MNYNTLIQIYLIIIVNAKYLGQYNSLSFSN